MEALDVKKAIAIRQATRGRVPGCHDGKLSVAVDERGMAVGKSGRIPTATETPSRRASRSSLGQVSLVGFEQI